MPMTYGQALALASVPIPGHLEADAQVPVLDGPQAQGDLMIVPLALAYEPGEAVPDWPDGIPLPPRGSSVLWGEATGNTHWLHAGFDSPGVRWHQVEENLVVGVLTVPPGQSAMLIHTDEHGANGIGPGRYEIRRKREQHDEIAHVAD